MTIGQLKQILARLEADWTAQDRELLGEFDYQPVCCDAFDDKGGYAGIGVAKDAYYDAQFGLMVLAENGRG